MNKNKLVIFMPSIEGGGVEKNLFIISNYLSKKIKGISLITASKECNNKFKGIKIINPQLNFGSSRKSKYYSCFLELFKLLLKKEKFVVFAFQANLYCIIICKIFRTRIVIRSNSSPSGWSKNYLKSLIFEKLLKLSDKIIVNSIDFKKELKKKFNVNSECIYNPLNKNEIIKKSKQIIKFNFFKKSKKKLLKIINIGRIVDQKDQITLLKSLNILKKENRLHFKALIMGRGSNKKFLDQYIKANNLQNCVKIIDFQINPYPYLHNSDLFILTSKFEGLPNVLLEAISLKKFVISTNCPTGPREILNNGKGGILFKIGDYEQLSEKIKEFCANRSKYNKKIIYAYKQLKRFDLRKNLKKYETIVNNQLLKK